MNHFIRRNWKRLTILASAAIVSAIILIPAQKAEAIAPYNVPIPPMEVITHCGQQTKTREEAIKLLVDGGFLFLNEVKIEGEVGYDSMLFFLNEEYHIFSYLTSKDKCIIDAYEMMY